MSGTRRGTHDPWRERAEPRRARVGTTVSQVRHVTQGGVVPLPRRPSELEQLPAPVPTLDHPTQTWSQPVGAGRLLARFVLGVATGGAAYGLGLSAHQHTPDSFAVLVGSAVAAALTWNALGSSTPTTVTLAGSVLHVRRGSSDNYFDLANPRTRFRVIGDPDRPSWRLRLENPDGRTVELHRNQVDAATVHALVLRHSNGRRGL